MTSTAGDAHVVPVEAEDDQREDVLESLQRLFCTITRSVAEHDGHPGKLLDGTSLRNLLTHPGGKMMPEVVLGDASPSFSALRYSLLDQMLDVQHARIHLGQLHKPSRVEKCALAIKFQWWDIHGSSGLMCSKIPELRTAYQYMPRSFSKEYTKDTTDEKYLRSFGIGNVHLHSLCNWEGLVVLQSYDCYALAAFIVTAECDVCEPCAATEATAAPDSIPDDATTAPAEGPSISRGQLAVMSLLFAQQLDRDLEKFCKSNLDEAHESGIKVLVINMTPSQVRVIEAVVGDTRIPHIATTPIRSFPHDFRHLESSYKLDKKGWLTCEAYRQVLAWLFYTKSGSPVSQPEAAASESLNRPQDGVVSDKDDSSSEGSRGSEKGDHVDMLKSPDTPPSSPDSRLPHSKV